MPAAGSVRAAGADLLDAALTQDLRITAKRAGGLFVYAAAREIGIEIRGRESRRTVAELICQATRLHRRQQASARQAESMRSRWTLTGNLTV